MMPSLGTGQGDGYRLCVDVGAASMLPRSSLAGVPCWGEQAAPCLRWGRAGAGNCMPSPGEGNAHKLRPVKFSSVCFFLGLPVLSQLIA